MKAGRPAWLTARSLLFLLSILLGVAAAADALAWRWAEQLLQAGLGDWMAARRGAGWQALAGAPVRGGWPFAAALTVPDLALSGPGGMPAGRAEAVTLTWSPARPDVLAIAATGRISVQLGAGPEIVVAAGHLAAVTPLDPSSTAPMTVAAERLRIGLAADPGAGTLDIATLAARIETRPGTARVSAQATEWALPQGRVRWPLGPTIARVAAAAVLDGVDLPPARAATAASLPARWRDHGGRLVVDRLDAAWGPTELVGTGTLTLDARLQPQGDGVARVTGYAEALDAMATAGLLTHGAAQAGKAVLGLIARAAPDGGPDSVEVPLALRDGTVSLDAIPVARVPDLGWPAP